MLSGVLHRLKSTECKHRVWRTLNLSTHVTPFIQKYAVPAAVCGSAYLADLCYLALNHTKRNRF